MTTILDIGARNGESIATFLTHPALTTIHAFEPMPVQYANILAAYDSNLRVHAHNYGLSNLTGPQTMYGADDHGEASVFATKVDLNPAVTTTCNFMRASVWFDEFVTEPVLVKMNCEGSEIAILNDLLDADLAHKIIALRVEFDISRVPEHAHETDLIIARLNTAHVNYTIGSDARLDTGSLVDRVPQLGTHDDRLNAWLTDVL